MNIIIWTIIICLFIISFVGVFIPIVPAVVAIWIGFFLYHFFISSEQLSVLFWIVMVIFTIILVGADLLTNRYFVHKFGGTKKSEWGAIIGVIIGTFIYPPFGMIFLPLLIVFCLEIIEKRPVKEAMLAAVGALAGFLSGVVAKIILQFIMIIWFVLTIFI